VSGSHKVLNPVCRAPRIPLDTLKRQTELCAPVIPLAIYSKRGKCSPSSTVTPIFTVCVC
jgi:hypothetical protein